MQPLLERVKHWFRKPNPQPPSPQSFASLDWVVQEEVQRVRHGEISVRDNQVFITNPDAEGSFATLEIPPDPRVTVTINGRPCTARTFVTEDDRVEVMFHPVESKRRLSIRVSDDKMAVLVRVEVTPGETYRLKDVDGAHHAVLEIEAQPVFPAPVEREAILAQLANAGYQGDLDDAALETVRRAEATMEAVVLRGRPPQPGKPARYKPVKLSKVYDPIRRRMDLMTVPAGATVAVLEPGLPGTPGQDVFGHEVLPPSPRPLPRLGRGVTEVGGRVVATRSGRLRFTRFLIDVVPELIIDHDLTPRDGRVEFDGDVRVLGTVLDGSFIHATGQVEVNGSVLSSTVMGECGVCVFGAVVASQVVAGCWKLDFQAVLQELRQCLEQFTRFEQEYQQLLENARTRADFGEKVPMLADVLMSKRHPDLDAALQHLSQEMSNLAEQDERCRALIRELRQQWQGIGRTNIDAQDVARLRQLLTDCV
ncbi:MAG: DUF342 domain-containing protein, partial [Alicyclobacillaceae bacterium]|nr:DUF342 domain-containing protein [Alicyclobacillaceae bacterium]